MEQARSAKRIIINMLLAAAAVCLCACSSQSFSSQPQLASAEALQTQQPRSISVEFWADGRLVQSQTLDEWSKPLCPEVQAPEGMRFLYWADENGKQTDPRLSPLREDAVYTAVFGPLLDKHVPYIFANEAGLLRPDAILDNTELVCALNALASDESKAHFPDMSGTGGAVSGEMLRQSLSAFYTDQTLDVAMVSLSEGSYVSRSQFVRIMNCLLERSSGETVTVAQGQSVMPDVQPARDDYAELLAASIPHGHGEGGVPWAEVELAPVYDPGFVLLEGWLYCVGEDGYFVCDTVMGSLTFGYDGRYTSGDGVLDGYVSGILRDLAFAHPGADSRELLRAAYNYVRDSFSDLRKNTYAVGAVGWQIPDAISMFECGQGSCYGYAASFWALARGLGYDAEALSGAIGKEMLPHAWVEIELDGTVYIFDPETEAECIREGETVRDMFMLHPDWAVNWQYYKG